VLRTEFGDGKLKGTSNNLIFEAQDFVKL